jgi:hypothetical protein
MERAVGAGGIVRQIYLPAHAAFRAGVVNRRSSCSTSGPMKSKRENGRLDGSHVAEPGQETVRQSSCAAWHVYPLWGIIVVYHQVLRLAAEPDPGMLMQAAYVPSNRGNSSETQMRSFERAGKSPSRHKNSQASVSDTTLHQASCKLSKGRIETPREGPTLHPLD